MNSRDFTIVRSSGHWYVMHGRHVYGSFDTEGDANAAFAAIREGDHGHRPRASDAGPRGTGAWENEGGAVRPRPTSPPTPPPRLAAALDALQPPCFAMFLCPDCLRIKPHWVTWHDGSCKVLCQDCGRTLDMCDGTAIHQAASPERQTAR